MPIVTKLSPLRLLPIQNWKVSAVLSCALQPRRIIIRTTYREGPQLIGMDIRRMDKYRSIVWHVKNEWTKELVVKVVPKHAMNHLA